MYIHALSSWWWGFGTGATPYQRIQFATLPCVSLEQIQKYNDEKSMHAEKYFLEIALYQTHNQVVFTVHRLIWIFWIYIQSPNELENVKYTLIWVWFNTISRKYFCVCVLAFGELLSRISFPWSPCLLSSPPPPLRGESPQPFWDSPFSRHHGGTIRAFLKPAGMILVKYHWRV